MKTKLSLSISIIFIISLLMTTSCQEKPAPVGSHNKIYQFGLIKRYADAPELPKAEADAIQEAHLSNIDRLHELGLLPLAGPFWDANEKEWAGLFFYDVPTKDSADYLAQTDPACEAKRLYVVNYPIECEGEIKFDEPVEMMIYTSIYIYSDDSQPIDFTYDEYLEMLLGPLTQAGDSSRIAFKGEFIDLNNDNLSALYIIDGVTVNEVQTIADNLPATSQKRWPLKIINWYGPKGLRLE